MSSRYFYEYLASQRLAAEITRIAGPANEFYTLIMAAIRLADSDNLSKLWDAFPDVYTEFRMRYLSPGGAITADELKLLDRYYEHSGDDDPGKE